MPHNIAKIAPFGLEIGKTSFLALLGFENYKSGDRSFEFILVAWYQVENFFF